MSDASVFFVCVAVGFCTFYICYAAADIFMRWTRSRNIVAHGCVAHGWPPEHVDADGDPVYRAQEDRDEAQA